MYQLVIEENPSAKKNHKTRQFSAVLLGYVTADTLLYGGDVLRPLFMALTGSEAALRPLVMNLRLGHKGTVEKIKNTSGWEGRKAKTWIEFLKSSGHEVTWQRSTPAIVTFCHNGLLQADPGMIDPDACNFVVLTPKWWVAEQLKSLTPDIIQPVLAHAKRLRLNEFNNELSAPAFSDNEIIAMLPQAARFCHYLDKRTRRPLLNSYAFNLQLYLAALCGRIASFPYVTQEGKPYSTSLPWGVWHWATGFREMGMERLGFTPPVLVKTTHQQLDIWLAEQVKLYRSVGGN